MTRDLPRRLTRTWGDPPPTWDHIIGGPPVTDLLTDTLRAWLDAAPISSPDVAAQVIDALSAVLDLHVSDDGACPGCSDSDPTNPVPWPCPTYRLVADALGVTP